MLLILLASLPALVSPGDSLGMLGRQVITAAMIDEAGLTRPSDLFYLMEGWDVASLDGFHSEATAGFLSPTPNTWSLWVDDQPVSQTLTGVEDLNQLPFSLQDVAYVEVFIHPVLMHGSFAGQGLIHIHTRQQANGFGLRAGYWQGNETGDPGPLRYLGETGNVDKLGPDVTAAARWGSRRVKGSVSAISRDHHPTDAAILPRIQAATSRYPNIVVRGASGRLFVEGLGGQHAVSGSVTSGEDYLWLKPYGRELPVQQDGARGQLSNTFRLGSTVRLHHATGLSTHTLGERNYSLRLNPDWRQRLWHTRIELERTSRLLAASVGVKLEGEQVQSDLLPSMYRETRPAVYAQLMNTGNSRFIYGLSGAVEPEEHGLATSAVASGAWRMEQNQSLSGVLAYSRQSLRDANPLWYWTHEGYGLLDSLAVVYAPLTRLPMERRLSGDLSWRYSKSNALHLMLGLMYRWSDHAILERQVLGLDPAGPAYIGPVQLAPGAEGHIVGGKAQVRSTALSTLSQQSSVTVRLLAAGEEAFEESWRAWPAVAARTSWTYAPVTSFSLNTRLSYRSRTEWPVSDSGEGSVQPEVRPSWILDVAARKWFWERRIRGNIIVRNALNRRYRYYPQGETTGLSLILHLSIHLNDR